MNVNLNINDVVSEEELKEVVIDAIRKSVMKIYTGNEREMHRLVSNLSYQFVFDMVDKQFGGELEKLLVAETTRVINELSHFIVFRESDMWGRKESVAYKTLHEEIAKKRPLIAQRVEEIILDYNYSEVRSSISEVVHECIMEKLFSDK